ncbi:MAG TPA: tRNA preQ1(34) S-adenosylmethionine ribosyltransferase-isomerase QueA [Deltaproteobacteria bacterium]|nr:MAG: tRNA preQ1(34) S-adenosylmethionine ribosyltransferase-isomerase QueA [Deltaproteobacteria bacterium GWA2_45_12]HBF13251.1 tRNA preQ1(34) S-adenosylmethionine ribosyltransferase-isomerase QueA [Deltaproteobacteria bacterium]
MNLSDLDYTYPPTLVVHYPLDKRESSRMMVLDRQKKTWQHSFFDRFVDHFQAGDVLVLNDSKVFPCRLVTKKETGGKLECFLIREIKPKVWECLISSSKKNPPGMELSFASDLRGVLGGEIGDGLREISLFYTGNLFEILSRIGHVPLPPYIKREDDPSFDPHRYQTVYARHTGSVAAPTAGFHLTPAILDQLKVKGVDLCFVTLHVGLGTFLPVRTENLKDHVMHREYFEITEGVAHKVNQAKKEKRKISVVGTTAVRALESAANNEGVLSPMRCFTDIFIHPPYRFKIVDRLLTNFHQPRSTLLALVCAFAGHDFVLDAYGEAMREKYRLFSYGDCMFIL